MAQNGFVSKPCIRTMSPYVGAKTVEEAVSAFGIDPNTIVMLANNENPYGMSPSAKKAAVEALETLERYPDSTASRLCKAIARHYGVPTDWVIFSNGSDELITLLGLLVLKTGTSCLFSQYAFSVYALAARENDAELIEVPARKDYSIDLEAMADSIRADTRLIFLTNPNNPTGLFFPEEAFATFMRRVPSDCLVMLDEAYGEYVPKELRFDSMQWAKRYPNLIVTHTFSKAYGLAGLRIGYGIAHPELVEMLNRIRLPYNMNSVAQATASAAMDDQTYVDSIVEKTRLEREKLQVRLQERGLRFLPSATNFLLVNFGAKAPQIVNRLFERGVIVRSATNYGLPEWVRLTVGTPEQNERFLRVYDAVKAEFS